MEEGMGKGGTGCTEMGGRAGSCGCKVMPSSEGTGEIVHRGPWICAEEEKRRWEWKWKEKKTKSVGTLKCKCVKKEK